MHKNMLKKTTALIMTGLLAIAQPFYVFAENIQIEDINAQMSDETAETVTENDEESILKTPVVHIMDENGEELPVDMTEGGVFSIQNSNEELESELDEDEIPQLIESQIKCYNQNIEIVIDGLLPENAYATVEAAVYIRDITTDMFDKPQTGYNITLFNSNGVQIQPYAYDTIATITIKDASLDEENAVYYTDGNNNTKELETIECSEGLVSFQTDTIARFIIVDITEPRLIEQTLTSDAGEVEIQVEGLMPKNTELITETITPEEILSEKIIGNVLACEDITLVSGDEEYQPEDYDESVQVTFKNIEISHFNSIHAYHITDDGAVEVPYQIIGDNVVIETDSFSPYILTGENGEPIGCLKFSSDANFTLKANNGKTWDGTLECTTDNGYTWTTWDGSQLSGTADQPIYLRGTGNTVITGNASANRWSITGSNVECHGNIENLLDYQTVANGEHPAMANYCYYYMFQNCASLTTAPELPATTLAMSCYCRMFRSCTSLATAPELPATTMADSCYSGMFYGCTSLEAAPELPATTMADSCYSFMFFNCKFLTEAPDLPATTLANQCYDSMFKGCTSLTEAPDLPATTLVESCYSNMFSGCTSLKLSATKTGIYQYPYRIPTTGTGTTATDALASMFTSTGGTFTGTPEINTIYYVPWNTLRTATITYINGSNTIHTDTVNIGDSYTLIQTTPVQANKRFVSWQYNSTRYNSGAEFGVVNGDITFTAEFVDTVTVTYKYTDRRTWTDITFKTETVDKGTNYVVTTDVPEYDGQTDEDTWHSVFKKWGYSSYSNTGYSPGETIGTINYNQTLYAMYESINHSGYYLDELILDSVGEQKTMTPLETVFGTPIEYIAVPSSDVDAYSYNATEVYNRYKNNFSTDIPSFSTPGEYTILTKIQGADGLYAANILPVLAPVLNVRIEIADEYQNGIRYGDAIDAEFYHPEKANDIVKIYNAETDERITPITISVFGVFDAAPAQNEIGGAETFNAIYPYCENAEKVIAFRILSDTWTLSNKRMLDVLGMSTNFGDTMFLPILPDTLIISANNTEKIEGEEDPELTYEVTGSFISVLKNNFCKIPGLSDETKEFIINSSGTELFRYLENPDYFNAPLVTLTRETGETPGKYTIMPSSTEIMQNMLAEIEEDMNISCDVATEIGTFTIYTVSSYIVTVPATLALETANNKDFANTANVNVQITSADPTYHVHVVPDATVTLKNNAQTKSAVMDTEIGCDDFTYQTEGMTGNDNTYAMDTALNVSGAILDPDVYTGNLQFTISAGTE